MAGCQLAGNRIADLPVGGRVHFHSTAVCSGTQGAPHCVWPSPSLKKPKLCVSGHLRGPGFGWVLGALSIERFFLGGGSDWGALLTPPPAPVRVANSRQHSELMVGDDRMPVSREYMILCWCLIPRS